jgi:hypothetical protein
MFLEILDPTLLDGVLIMVNSLTQQVYDMLPINQTTMDACKELGREALAIYKANDFAHPAFVCVFEDGSIYMEN